MKTNSMIVCKYVFYSKYKKQKHYNFEETTKKNFHELYTNSYFFKVIHESIVDNHYVI